MKKYVAVLLFGIIFLFPSCYKIVDADFVDIKPQLVMLSFFSPDSIFKVRVGRSVGLNEFDRADTLIWLDDAVCSLYVDNSFYQVFLSRGNGWYVSPTGYHPVAGRKYKMIVWHSVYGRAEAESYVPQKTTLMGVQFLGRIERAGDLGVNHYLKYGFSLADEPDEKNYYELYVTDLRPEIVYSDLGSDDIDTVYLDTNLFYISTYNPVLLENASFGYSLIFSDKYIKTSSVKVSFLINETSKTLYGYLIKNLQIHLRVLSSDAYKYKLQIVKYFNTDEGIWQTSEIVISPYSNVIGGYGIFAGYNETVDSSTFPVSLDQHFIDSLLNY